MLKHLLVFICLSYSLILHATNAKTTISGYVFDNKTGEKIIGASVIIFELNAGTNSNNYGFYSLTVPKGNYQVVFSYVGYQSDTIDLSSQSILKKDVRLDRKSTSIKDIKVVAKKKAPIQQTSQLSMNSIPLNQIKALPAIFGEVDVLKALQLLPGVQGGTEGSSGIYVRGGGPDQNLFLLDGVPLYNVNHLGGMFSTFNADAISNVDLYKGGFPARFGGRLSSVVDIRMKEGNYKTIKGEASTGIISSKLMLEGPIVKDKGSFMISGRRTYIDALISPIVKAQSGGNSSAGYYFYDLNTKLNYKLGKKDHLYLSGYFGRDVFYFRNKEKFPDGNGQSVTTTNAAGLNWGNKTGVLRWNHLFNDKLFGNLSTSYSSYDYKVGASSEETYTNANNNNGFAAVFSSGIEDVAVKYDMDWLPNYKHNVKFGVGNIFHQFTPSVSNLKINGGGTNIDTSLNNIIINAKEIDAYIEDDWKISKQLKANIGLHYAGFAVRNVYYQGLQPRISARYLINEDYSIKASYTRMNQFLNLLNVDGIGLPTDLWVPVTDKIKAQSSNQFAVGAAGTYNKTYEVSVEGYYKSMQNIIDYKDGSSYLGLRGSYEDIVEMGIGRSYGGELLVQKKEGRLQGLMSYGIAWAQRKYNGINNGNWYYYKYDRRHDFKIAGIYKINDRVELSGDWVYNTGNWTTLPELGFNPTAPTGLNSNNSGNNFLNAFNYYPSRNNFNMMDYHRMDLGARFIRVRKRYTRTWALGCYNIYGRKNPFFIFLGNDSQGNDQFQQASLFGFPLPYLTLDVKF
jgi:hypothetical protein